MNNKIYKKLIYIAIPIALENMTYSIVNFIDIFMIGKIGKEAISALGISNQLFFILVTSVFGLISGSNVLSAQYFGNKEYDKLKKIVFINMIISLVLAFLFFTIIKIFPNYVVSYYTDNTVAKQYTIQYLDIITYTFPLFAIGFSITMVLRAMKKPQYSFYSSIIAVIINIILNLILIPIFQVKGAAIATLIARLFSVIYLIYILFKNKIDIIPSIKDIMEININFIKKVLSISSLTFIHEIFWVLALTIKVMLYGKLGIVAFSSIQIVESINRILFTFIIGLSNATAIIIGNEIGKNNIEKTYQYSKECIKIFTFILLLIVILLNLFAPYILNIMKVEESIYPIVRKLIYSQSIVTILSSYSILYLVGILRSGGDVMYSMIIELVFIWLLGLPITYIFVKIYTLPVYYVYIIAWLDDLVKLVPCIIRHKSKKWIKRKI